MFLMMKNKNNINKVNIYFFFILYFSLIIGFIYDENLNGGAKPDWFYTDIPAIKGFYENFFETFFSYDKFNHRHSPVYLIFLSFFSKIGINFDFIRFIHLNICLVLIYIFFKCLDFKFKNIDKNILFLISISIFLSPTFRSLAIWPDTRIIGLIFFTFSIYEFLKFNEENNIKNFYKTIIFLIIASYISPNFSVFIIFYLFYFFKKVDTKHILLSFLIGLISSIPALYYLFVLDINFLLAATPGVNKNAAMNIDFNISNKILVISTIIFFHLIPFLFSKDFFKELILTTKKYIIYILIFFIINLLLFDYVISFTGGGFFFQFSNLVLGNNFIFYLFCLISLIILSNFFRYNVYNFLLYSLLILSNIQNSIYHKYYDPLIMILFFLLTFHSLPEKFLSNKKNLILLYLFYFTYILLRIIKKLIYLY